VLLHHTGLAIIGEVLAAEKDEEGIFGHETGKK